MQDGKKPIIQSIRDYVMTYPDIDDRKINIDYLGNGMEYSIDPIGADPIYKRYVDGSCLKQFQFAFTSKEAYDGDARTGIANSGFYQDFAEWTEQFRRYPPGAGRARCYTGRRVAVRLFI